MLAAKCKRARHPICCRETTDHGKKPKSAKIWIANKNFQNLEEILEMHSLIRLILSAP